MIKSAEIERKCHYYKNKACKNEFMCNDCKYQPEARDLRNGNEPPKKVNYENDFGLILPFCPSCDEPAYENDYCVFCGQKFIQDEKPPQNETVYRGMTEDGKCLNCGSVKLEFVYHSSSFKFYENTYRCKNCKSLCSERTLLTDITL